MNSARPNSFSLVEKNEGAQGLSVLTVSLDDLFEWEKLARLDYLKIDVEGAEREIFSGATSTIKNHRPIVQAEVIEKHFIAELPDYSIFQAPGSPNVVYIPNEHEKIRLPKELGWSKIES
jgi:hypothetical protein